MTRPLTLSNGSLHVGLNERAQVTDFYYPFVGQENHVAGEALRHRVGVWVEGRFSWLDSDDWSFDISLETHALIGSTHATNKKLGVRLDFTDTVYSDGNAFLRSIHVWNLGSTPREVRLFMHQVFAIGDSRSNTDTAQYLPENNAVLHYRGRRAFVVSGRYGDQSFNAHSIGLYGIEGREGTFRDAEDGELGNNAVEHGRIDSVIGFYVPLAAHDSALVDYWIAAGKSMTDALHLHTKLRAKGLKPFITQTASHWKGWLSRADIKLAHIDPKYHDAFRSSLMILKSHMDNHGAIIASTDTTMLNYARDAYAYCWPRDGAYVSWPLIRLGYTEEPLKFFRFIRRVLHSGGYVMHKYFADGSLGPSWHPYVHGSVAAAPIQEDETATVLFMLAELITTSDADDLLDEFYALLVQPMAEFLCSFIEEKTGLPKPSYDLWEEVFATSTYTTASVYGALIAASDLAERHNSPNDALHWRTEAEALQKKAQKTLFNADRGYFYKNFNRDEDGKLAFDATVDSASLYGVLTFGLYDRDSDEVKTAIETYRTVLGHQDPYDGIARYESDNYDRNENSGVGNPWFITSLWQAQTELSQGNRDKARFIIDWVGGHAGPTGVLAEQADRISGTPLSVSPLAWSHAEYLNTLMDLGTQIEK